MDRSTSAAGYRVLVVDDEDSMRDLVSSSLEFVGYTVRSVATGYAGMSAVADFAPHLIVLDVSMPGLGGVEMCQRLRQAGDTTPVIFLTARDAVDDTVEGFAAGGDDYLTKPFHLKELVARVQAVLKRTAAATSTPDRLVCADLEMEEATHRVWRGGQRVDLSPTEYRLLRYLMRNAGIVVSKAQILENVWQYDFGGDASVVETYMSTLRRKADRPMRASSTRCAASATSCGRTTTDEALAEAAAPPEQPLPSHPAGRARGLAPVVPGRQPRRTRRPHPPDPPTSPSPCRTSTTTRWPTSGDAPGSRSPSATSPVAATATASSRPRWRTATC